jgi:hypothetical protein
MGGSKISNFDDAYEGRWIGSQEGVWLCVRILFVCVLVLCVAFLGTGVFWLAGLTSITDQIEICKKGGNTHNTHINHTIP